MKYSHDKKERVGREGVEGCSGGVPLKPSQSTQGSGNLDQVLYRSTTANRSHLEHLQDTSYFIVLLCIPLHAYKAIHAKSIELGMFNKQGLGHI